MSRSMPTIALGLAIAVAAVLAILALGATSPPTTAERAEALAAELRCPDCEGLSVADSPTSSAREIRRQIDELLAAGATDDEVRAHFVARYGEWIRLAPSAAVFWVVPFVAVAIGAGLLLLRLRTRGADEPPPAAVSDVERRAVRDEAEALDA